MFLSLIHLFSNWSISWLISFSCSETFYPDLRLSLVFWIDEVTRQMRNLQVSIGHSEVSKCSLIIYTWQPGIAEGQPAWWHQWMQFFFTELVMSNIANLIFGACQFLLSSCSALLFRLTFPPPRHTGPVSSMVFSEPWRSDYSSMTN